MRAPDCFILYSFIITVMLCGSGLVMGRPIDPGTENNRLPQTADLQARINILQMVRGSLLSAMEIIPNILKDAEKEYNILPQNVDQQEEKMSMLQKFLKSVFDGVELMSQILKDIKNLVPTKPPVSKPVESTKPTESTAPERHWYEDKVNIRKPHKPDPDPWETIRHPSIRDFAGRGGGGFQA